MPKITINGTECEFKPGQMILQVANDHGIKIPQYCYHDGLSIVASCRICLAEVWAPNPRNDNRLEPIPKLLPTCQTTAGEGQVVYTDSPKSIANQKAVMEYLLINHPLDCPVCDQAGECDLQDYSYEYGRGTSRFEETKVKQPKKDLGPHVYLYSDRCIMCTRCVRFTREVTGTSELIVEGRGNRTEIDIFPGEALDNELSANVIDLCPVGALLDKDFLFAQRVWFLRSTPSIDGITASGDNILVEHNEGKVYRLKPRTNMAVNKWWISDEVRYGWKFLNSDARLATPSRRQFGARVSSDWTRAMNDAVKGLRGAHRAGADAARIALLVSPMLSCEDAYSLLTAVLALDEHAVIGVGPIPIVGEDKVFPPTSPDGFRIYAEKCPNARGVRRVLEAVAGPDRVLAFDAFLTAMGRGSGRSNISGAVLTGNYPSEWAPEALLKACAGKFLVVIDTLDSPLAEMADVVLPAAAWIEKAGTFENARGLIQAFEQAVPPFGTAKCEGQIGLDLLADLQGTPSFDREPVEVRVVDEQPGMVPMAVSVAVPAGEVFNAATIRQRMATEHPDQLRVFVTSVLMPSTPIRQEPDMEIVEV